MGPNKLSSEHNENEVLTLTSKSSSSEDQFETKLKTKFDKYDKGFEQQQQELMDLKVKHHQESK